MTFSNNSADYALGAPIGFGASSIVYSALYHPPPPRPDARRPTPIPCALKVLDLDSLPLHALRLLKRETTLMSLSKHPNVLRVRGSWMDGHKLYIALRLMSKGSAADVMRYAWPGGMEEDVVRCILKQALEGLKFVARRLDCVASCQLMTCSSYLHINGFIHRDIKAANLLIDDDGTVLLGDLGVAANLADDTDLHAISSKRIADFDQNAKPIRPKMGKRKSFVGTVSGFTLRLVFWP
jgi:serine/threonine-protein kinase OSR1/STK39